MCTWLWDVEIFNEGGKRYLYVARSKIRLTLAEDTSTCAINVKQ